MTARVHRTAAVVAIGDELTLGQKTDTNSAWISRFLLDRGVEVVEHATAADDLDRLTAMLTRLAGEVDLIVSTGGLGPTLDDLTREALAGAMGDQLVTDAAALDHVRGWFAGRGAEMPERNAVQAQRPAGGACVANDNGTAPGLLGSISRNGRACDVLCLPGPPREMIPMAERELARILSPDPARTVITRALPTFGLGESTVAQKLAELMHRDRNPVVGTTASRGIVTCRVRHDGADAPAAATEIVEQTVRVIRERLGAIVLSDDESDHPLIESVAALLDARAETVSCAESCTGGLLGAELTRLPGSSASFLGGLLTYSNDAKSDLAGVDPAVIAQHGAVSQETAVAMAAGTRGRLGSDHALAISGVAGPGGGTPDKPVGTVCIALDSEGAPPDARRFRFAGGRDAVRAWSVSCALAMLRLRLLGEQMTLIGEVPA